MTVRPDFVLRTDVSEVDNNLQYSSKSTTDKLGVSSPRKAISGSRGEKRLELGEGTIVNPLSEN